MTPMAEVLRTLRMHGQGSDRYEKVRIGMNSRLDTVQAAILSEKMKIFPTRSRRAQSYCPPIQRGAGDETASFPMLLPVECPTVWAQYTLRITGEWRDAFAAALKADGIPTAVYYPIPLHRQQAYKHYPVGQGGVAVSDKLAAEVISPPDARLSDEPTQGRIVDAVRRALKS